MFAGLLERILLGVILLLVVGLGIQSLRLSTAHAELNLAQANEKRAVADRERCTASRLVLEDAIGDQNATVDALHMEAAKRADAAARARADAEAVVKANRHLAAKLDAMRTAKPITIVDDCARTFEVIDLYMREAR